MVLERSETNRVLFRLRKNTIRRKADIPAGGARHFGINTSHSSVTERKEEEEEILLDRACIC